MTLYQVLEMEGERDRRGIYSKTTLKGKQGPDLSDPTSHPVRSWDFM